MDQNTYQNLTNRVKEQVKIAVYLSSKTVTKQYHLQCAPPRLPTPLLCSLHSCYMRRDPANNRENSIKSSPKIT